MLRLDTGNLQARAKLNKRNGKNQEQNLRLSIKCCPEREKKPKTKNQKLSPQMKCGGAEVYRDLGAPNPPAARRDFCGGA